MKKQRREHHLREDRINVRMKRAERHDREIAVARLQKREARKEMEAVR